LRSRRRVTTIDGDHCTVKPASEEARELGACLGRFIDGLLRGSGTAVVVDVLLKHRRDFLI
jgi:hypothetical protein